MKPRYGVAALFLFLFLTYPGTSSAVLNPSTERGAFLDREIARAQLLAKDDKVIEAVEILFRHLHEADIGRHSVLIEGRPLNARKALLQNLYGIVTEKRPKLPEGIAESWLEKVRQSATEAEILESEYQGISYIGHPNGFLLGKELGDNLSERGSLYEAQDLYEMGKESAEAHADFGAHEAEYEQMLSSLSRVQSWISTLLSSDTRSCQIARDASLEALTLKPVKDLSEADKNQLCKSVNDDICTQLKLINTTSLPYQVGARRLKLSADKEGTIHWLVYNQDDELIAPFMIKVGNATSMTGSDFLARSQFFSKDGKYYLVSPDGVIRLNSRGEFEEVASEPWRVLKDIGLVRESALSSAQNFVSHHQTNWRSKIVRRHIEAEDRGEIVVYVGGNLKPRHRRAIRLARETRDYVRGFSSYGEYAIPYLLELLSEPHLSLVAAQEIYAINPNFQFSESDLTDPDKGRVWAFEATGHLASQTSVPYLIEKLKDSRLRVRAIQAIANLGAGASDATPALMDLLDKSDDQREVHEIVRAFRRIGPRSIESIEAVIKKIEERFESPELVGLLRDLKLLTHEDVPVEKLQDRHYPVRAREAVGQLANRLHLPYLISKIEEGTDVRLIVRSVRALREIGRDANSALDALARRYEATQSSAVRDEIALTLAEITFPEVAANYIVDRLENHSLSIGVVQAIGKIGHPARKAVPRLIELLEYENLSHRMPQLSEAACEALGKLGGDAKQAIPTLLRVIEQRPSAPILMQALWALGRMGKLDKSHLSQLQTFFDRSDQKVKAAFLKNISALRN